MLEDLKQAQTTELLTTSNSSDDEEPYWCVRLFEYGYLRETHFTNPVHLNVIIMKHLHSCNQVIAISSPFTAYHIGMSYLYLQICKASVSSFLRISENKQMQVYCLFLTKT